MFFGNFIFCYRVKIDINQEAKLKNELIEAVALFRWLYDPAGAGAWYREVN